MSDSQNNTIQMLIKEGVIRENKTLGCNDEEIKKLEDYYNIVLPQPYIIFLKTLGKNTDLFLNGTDFLFDKLFKLREYAIDLLDKDGISDILEANDFVFMSHQGYQFLFFKTSSSDTSIYYYEEGEKKAQKVYDNFDEWFFETAKDEIEAMKSV